MSSQQPPATDPFVDRLPGEIGAWQSESLLPAGTGRILLARYGLVPGETALSLRRSRIVSIMSVLAAILIGVGVILIMGANWEAIPRWLRLAILIAATAGSYCLGYRLAVDRRTYPKAGMALLLLGSMLWGASIFLISQMYHLGGEGGESTGMLYWFLGVLPMAYVLRSRLHLGLALVIGTVWLLMDQFPDSGHSNPAEAAAAHLLAVGALLYCAGLLHDAWEPTRRYANTIKVFALLYFLLPVYFLSYRLNWESLGMYAYGRFSRQGLIHPWLELAIISVAVATVLAVRARRNRPLAIESISIAAIGLVASVAIVVVTTALISTQKTSYSHPQPLATWLALGFNLILFGLEVGIITVGWFRNMPGWVNLGLVAFGIHVVTRYFDIFGSMLRGGIFFMGVGVAVLLCCMALERARRRPEVESREEASI